MMGSFGGPGGKFLDVVGVKRAQEVNRIREATRREMILMVRGSMIMV